MSALSTAGGRMGAPERRGVSFAGILAGEWIKLGSLRSTWWVTASIVPVSLLIAVLVTASLPSDYIAQVGAERSATLLAQAAGSGLIFPQLIIVILGTLAITSEYGTGMIRSSFAAVPTRFPLLAGKAIVVGLAAFATGVLSAGLSWLVCAPLLAARGAVLEVGLPSIVLWSVLGTGAVLALTAVFALGVGTIVRSSAAGLSISVGVLFVLNVVMQIVIGVSQSKAVEAFQSYLLAPASGGAVGTGNGDLSELPSLLVVAGWAAVAFVIGSAVAARRDV